MDKRNSKDTMLKHIKYLTGKLRNVYEVGMNGIEYVGVANYRERESQAKANLIKAMYGDSK